MYSRREHQGAGHPVWGVMFGALGYHISKIPYREKKR
jgi:hypothetical protein